MKNFFAKNTPVLKTKRLRLRRFTEKDVEALFEILSDEEVNAFLPVFPLKTKEEAKEYLEERYLKNYKKAVGYYYAVCLKKDNKPIGYIHMNAEESHDLGYALRKEFWNQGIMTEAGLALLACLARRGVAYVTATHDVNNPKSGAVMKKLGMRYCYTYCEQWQPKNIPVTFRLYQLNLDADKNRVFQTYWQKSPVHYIEENI